MWTGRTFKIIGGLLLAVFFAVPAFAAPAPGWELNSKNPLVSPGALGSWDDFKVGSPSVIIEDGEYRIWYRGCHFVGSDFGCAIGRATSKDGANWIKDPEPVLTLADPSESKGLHTVAVLKHAGVYLMYYSVSADPFGKRPFARVYLATSPDGLTWKKEGAVLRAIHKHTFSIAHTVLNDGRSLHLWYMDAPHPNGVTSLLHVTSADGKTWSVAGSTGLAELHLAHFGPGASRIGLLQVMPGSYLAYSALSHDKFRFLRSSDGTEWQAGDGEEIMLPQGSTLAAPTFLQGATGVTAWFAFKTANGVESIGSAFHPGSIAP